MPAKFRKKRSINWKRKVAIGSDSITGRSYFSMMIEESSYIVWESNMKKNFKECSIDVAFLSLRISTMVLEACTFYFDILPSKAPRSSVSKVITVNFMLLIVTRPKSIWKQCHPGSILFFQLFNQLASLSAFQNY